MDKILLTNSALKTFCGCPRKYQLRYVDQFDSLSQNDNLMFGSVIHDALESWHLDRNLSSVLALIDSTYPSRCGSWHLATSMMTSYTEHYAAEDFSVVALEHEFAGPVINPATGGKSRKFTMAGKVDGIVKMANEYWLLEHKTAAQIDSAYLERLWTDQQIILYSHYLEQTLGVTISGVIYNVLTKAKLKQSTGETEDEFEQRKAELVAKSKTGKTSAKRKIPESDEAFQARLLAKYREQGMFHREILYLTREHYRDLQDNLWSIIQHVNQCYKGGFYRNTSNCFQYNRPCKYYPICTSGDNPLVIENHYQKVPAHSELNGAGNEPIF